MFAILLSAINVALGFLVRSVLLKFGAFTILFFITTGLMEVIAPMLPNASSLSSSFAGIPADVWFFLDLFNVSAGVPLVLSAYVTRFIIRRIPVIG